jgi:hypothetical protein
MKGSDSTNSLTELTSVQECFICLAAENDVGEPLVSSKLLRNCGCKFFVHPGCWNVWIRDKSDYDCPICRKASVLRISIPPNPVLSVEIPRERRRPYRLNRSQSCACFAVMAFAAAILYAIFHSE